MQLSDIFDKMNAYDRIIKDYKFNSAGLGERAWPVIGFRVHGAVIDPARPMAPGRRLGPQAG